MGDMSDQFGGNGDTVNTNPKKSPTLLIDVSYLAYRAYFGGMSKLSYEAIPTGVTYGVLREILFLMERFDTKRIAFCFDHGKPDRKMIYPSYKENRSEGTKEDQAAKEAVRKQVNMLRKEYLSMVGFQNILYQKGFEADDVIAKVIQDRPKREFIIVSSDQDLYQLLGKYVRIYLPSKKSIVTEESFRKEFGCGPQTWIQVKAMAGCSTDNVKGIPGIGPKTAIKFITGELTKGKAFDKIIHGSSITKRNINLVSLPYPGIESFSLRKDDVSPERWRSLIDRLGFASLAGSLPGIPRRSATEKNSFTRASLGVFKKGKGK